MLLPLAERSLLLGGARAADALVAVGERGHVLISQDEGTSWRQVWVPTRATLTAVRFHGGNRGFAVGHDAVILRTGDGGLHWERVYYAPEEERPLLDVLVESDRVLAVGAYGFYLESRDGGDTWQTRVFKSVAPGDEEPPAQRESDEAIGEDLHLNQIARAENGDLFIAAEAGTVYRSRDDGMTWQRLAPPYEGSFFGVLPLQAQSLLVFGLQGRLFRTDDAGETWRSIETGTSAVLMNGARLADGTAIVVGSAGTLLVSHDGGNRFQLRQQPERRGFASALERRDGGLLLLGEGGIRPMERSVADQTRGT